MSIVAERVTIDPVMEDPTLSPLDLVGIDPSWGVYLLEHDYSPPKPEIQRAGSADTEGDPVVNAKYPNRTITARVRIVEPEDPASTNLAINPIAALNATTWVGVSLLSGPTRVLPANNPRGKGTSTAIEAQTNAAADYLYHDTISVTSGKTYRASLYVQLAANTATGVRIVVYNAAGAAKKAEGATFATVDTTAEGWARLNVSFTADATANWRVGVEQVGAGAATFRATALLVEESATLTPFFCGETPGCDWSGSRHASTSTRPAPNGTRFSRIYRDITRKLDRITRQKVGTYRRHAPGFSPLVFDLKTAEITDAPQDIGIGMKRAEIGLSFEALPFGREAEQLSTEREEKALPANILLAEGVPGDVPALGRLVIEDKQGQNQGQAWWGLRQEHYSASADAALFYEAETRTPLGSAAATELATASGAGKNTIALTNLVEAYQGILSTQASGGGNQLAHAGSYRVLARLWRPTGNTGEVSAKLVWTTGDFAKVTQNDEVRFGVDDREGAFTVEDFGVVTIPEPTDGSTPRWEGRIMGKSTAAGDDLYIDCLILIPVDEGAGEVKASLLPAEGAPLSIFDPFNQEVGSGPISGKIAARIGGPWSGAGDADDFAIDAANHWVTRVAVSDVFGTPRFGLLEGKFSDFFLRARLWTSNPVQTSGTCQRGILLRYTNAENWLACWLVVGNIGVGGANYYLQLRKKVAGAEKILASIGPIETVPQGTATPPITIEAMALSTGAWLIGVDGEPLRTGNSDTDLATGGALKEGQVGLFDQKTNAVAETRFYDLIEGWVPSVDQAFYANRQLVVFADKARRQDSTGTTWGDAAYEGDFILVPPAGPEKAISQLITKGSRSAEADSGIDDQLTKLYVTPRYLVAPPS